MKESETGETQDVFPNWAARRVCGAVHRWAELHVLSDWLRVPQGT